MTGLENARKSPKYDNNVGDTTDEDTNRNCLVPSKAGIREPGTKYWNYIRKEGEEQCKCISKLQAPPQSTGRFLCALGCSSSSVSPSGQRKLHEISPNLDDTIVRSAFGKLHGAENKGGGWDLVGYSPKCGTFLFRRPGILRIVQVLFFFANRRLRAAIIDLEFLVMDWIADFFNGGKGTSAMGFSNL